MTTSHESILPAGSLPARSLVPPKAKLSITIEPIWPTIRRIRDQVKDALLDFPTAVRNAAMMTASELVENAIKYGETVKAAPTIRFRFEIYEEQVRIEVANGCTNFAGIQELFDCVRQISAAPDKEALYLSRVQVLLEDQQETGKLGLYRIAFEGQFTLYSSYENEVVTVSATRNLP